MPDRRLSCLESVVLVVSNSCSSKARAGLAGRLAGLLPAAFLATALPRRTLFQRLVFCMIDHGRLPASLRAREPIMGPGRVCLWWKDDPSGLQRKSLVFVSRAVSPVQSSPVHRVQMDHGEEESGAESRHVVC